MPARFSYRLGKTVPGAADRREDVCTSPKLVEAVVVYSSLAG